MVMTEREAYDVLSAYTLTLHDATFVHQHIVDAFAAQNAHADSKPITTAFALIGLYLHVERGYSGKQVQQAHMRLARKRKRWPRFDLPAHRGDVTAADVLSVPPGDARLQAIAAWCVAVWEAWRGSRERVAGLLADFGE